MLNLINKIFSNLPISLLEKTSGSNLILPFYHTVSDKELVHIKHLFSYKGTEEFRKDIDFLLSRYKPISLIELIEFTKNKQPLPEKSFLLTFDDGLSEVYENIAPILKEKGVPAVFFLNSDFLDNKDIMFRFKASILIEKFMNIKDTTKRKNILEKTQDTFKNKFNLTFLADNWRDSLLSVLYAKRDIFNIISHYLGIDFNEYLKKHKIYLSSNQVKSLINDGFDIGAHSINHPYYSSVPIEEQIRQTTESLDFLSNKFNVKNRTFAFPFNDISVSNTFFSQMNSYGNMDISFGSSEMKQDFTRNNYQRVAVEETDLPIELFFKQLFIKKTLRKMLNKDHIRR